MHIVMLVKVLICLVICLLKSFHHFSFVLNVFLEDNKDQKKHEGVGEF